MLVAAGAGTEEGDLPLIEEGFTVGRAERVVDTVGMNEGGVPIVGFIEMVLVLMGDFDGEGVVADVCTGVVVCNCANVVAAAAADDDDSTVGMCADGGIICGDIVIVLLLLLLFLLFREWWTLL